MLKAKSQDNKIPRKKGEIPPCDLCDDGTPAKYDTKTTLGAHAFLCERHHEQYGIPPTSEFVEIEEREVEAPEEIKTVSVPLTLDSVATVKCPYCQTPRRVEPDANYTVTCEGCGNDYNIRSAI